MNSSHHVAPPAPPAHVAIIMDGNGRWATARGLPRIAGHRSGADAVRRTVKAAAELEIAYLTLFGFSSENWRRPAAEIDGLMGLLRHYLRGEIAEIHRNRVRLRIIGQRARLAPDIITLIENGEALTRENTGLQLTIALSYGGRDEIAMAARALAIDEMAVGEHLLTTFMPDPDLVIRTSGEQRISNFLLWQTAYAEFIFTETLWPDFAKSDLEAALRDFHGRDRRYGASVGSG
jgi:undecaprenyl diphosphate synthase